MSTRPPNPRNTRLRGGVLAGGAVLAITGGLLAVPIDATPANAAEPTGYASTEPQLWHSGFEQQNPPAPAEWTSAGTSAWEFLDLAGSLEKYGTDRRQAFSRASGTFAVAETNDHAFSGTLTSQPISLAAGEGGPVELRLDSHFLRRGNGPTTAKITAAFDGGTPTELVSLGTTDRESEQLRLPLQAPTGAKNVTLEFTYVAPEGAGSWRVDDVELVRPLAPLAEAAQPSAVVDVFSDVQGANANVRMRDQVIPGLRALKPAAKTIVTNGDLTPLGADSEFTAYYDAYNAAVGDQYKTKISTIGNHEFYGPDGAETAITRFLDRTNMRSLAVPGSNPAHGGLWGETLVDGKLPVLWIGSEFYNFGAELGGGPFVKLSDEQFSWLQGRLAHWSERKTPVLLFTHHVLSNSVSGTHESFYQGEFGADEARYRELLGQHPNVTLFNSHTHSSPGLGDWSVEQRFTPTAKHGPTIVNTVSVNDEYGPLGDWGAAPIANTGSVGLRVGLYDDRVRVTAYRFATGGAATQVNQIDIARPAQGKDPEPQPEAKIALKSGSVAQGGTAAVSGTNFAPNEPLTLELRAGTGAAADAAPAGPGETPAPTQAPAQAPAPTQAPAPAPAPSPQAPAQPGSQTKPQAPSTPQGAPQADAPTAKAAAPQRLTADAAGSFAATLSVPKDTPVGAHTVVVRRADGGELSLPLQVTAAAEPGGGGNGGGTGGGGTGTGGGTSAGTEPWSGEEADAASGSGAPGRQASAAGKNGGASALARTGGQELLIPGIIAAIGVVAGGILLARRRRA
ncbi:hypothetical protein JD292_07360 [Leucobacter sp. CSA2]|uniref:Calcineurin-like phosphoesterase domain-containing protein n=1 Tax=Leucobacter edaphi TaxID=2796472 RepID=A0A934QC18_9MICO|nr:metallophosphoesterase [Leucobacter edaphi]MBK0421890.1 hypothetical protein [Leucobacter edaphi]